MIRGDHPYCRKLCKPFKKLGFYSKRNRNMLKGLKHFRSFQFGSAEMNLTSNHEDAGSIPGLAQWLKDLALL